MYYLKPRRPAEWGENLDRVRSLKGTLSVAGLQLHQQPPTDFGLKLERLLDRERAPGADLVTAVWYLHQISMARGARPSA